MSAQETEAGENPARARRRDMLLAFFYLAPQARDKPLENFREGEKRFLKGYA